MNIDTNAPSTGTQVQGLHTQRRSPAVAPAFAVHTDPINILIVDDEPKNLTVLETVLDDPDYRLVRAGSADQALHALVMEEFALLILDIRLPGMTGFELAQMIKQRKKTADLPIIFLTAYYNEDQHVLEGYGTGAVDYLVKPVNPAILRSKVAVFAELHRKRLALFAEVTERRRVEEQLRELNDSLEQRVTERTQALEIARASLHETGERYRSLFEGSLDAIFFLDADERFKAANPAALQLITRTLEELKTIRFLDLCESDQRETVRQLFHDAFRRQGFAIDTALVTVTGERRDLFISGAPEIQDGKVVGISCIARDITQRIKTEEALRLSETRYRELIQGLPAAVYTTDERGHITLYNQAAIALWGREPEVGKDLWGGWWKAYRPDGTPLPLDKWPMTVALREGRPIRGEEILIERPDGTRRNVLPHPEPMRNARGAIIGGINMLIDITDQKKAETKLLKQTAMLQEQTEIMNLAHVLVRDMEDRIIHWNVGAQRLYGFEPHEAIGMVSHDRLQTAFPEPLERIRETLKREDKWTGELSHKTKDGHSMVVLSHWILHRDGNSEPVAILEVNSDITDRKRIEADLRESEERLRLAQKAGKIGAFEWNMKTGVNTWSKELEAMYGLPPGGFPGTQKAWESLVHSEDRPHALERVKHSIDTGEPGEAEFRVVWPDGSTHWLTGRWQVFKDETGSPLCLTGVNIDVTADKKAEAALRESEARFHAIADAAPVLIWISGPDKQCSYVNKGWLDFTGRTIEQELGNGWTEGVYSGDFDLCLKTYVEAFDKQGPFEMEFRLRRFDGQYRWILDRGIPRLGPDGTFLGYIGTCIDITELKQAKETVQESEERLGGIISSAMDAIITIDEMQRVTDFNNAAELMFGCAAAAALGQPIDHFIPERFRAKHTHHIRAFGDTQVTKRQMGALGTIYGRRADGNEFPIEASISQLRTHAGKFYTVILRDITDRVRHEEVLQERDHTLTTVNESLKKHAVALAEANKELEGFSYSVSHDLRAPLRTIDAFSRIVEEDHGPRLNDEGRRSLSIVRKAVGQAGELIDDLLEFSKLGRQGMSFRVVKMADLAREAAENLRIMREGRQVELTIGDLPACQGDRRFLKLVWMNLLTNAFKYTKNRKEARIDIGWMPDDRSADSVIYYVKDNGIGFNMAYAHKLFGVFQRLHPREDFDGTGVGLAVVQRIVQRHDGRVWAEGKVDEGATFFFSLRRATA